VLGQARTIIVSKATSHCAGTVKSQRKRVRNVKQESLSRDRMTATEGA